MSNRGLVNWHGVYENWRVGEEDSGRILEKLDQHKK